MHRDARALLAWSVHLLTASGAAIGLLALIAIGEGRFRAALGWMALAVFIDGLDGPLARRLQVAPFDGALLDNLVDYLNYVVVPAYLLTQLPTLPSGTSSIAAVLICLVSAYQFCQVDAKGADGTFKGFPSAWNVVVFYLMLLEPAPPLALAVVVLLCLLVFVPLRYVHPVRTRRWRPATLVLTAVWAALLIGALVLYPDRRPWVVYASMLYLAYYGLLSLYLHRESA